MKLLAIARTNSWVLVKHQDAIFLANLLIHNIEFSTWKMSIPSECVSRNWSITTFFSQYDFPYSSEMLLPVLKYWWELGGHVNSVLYILMVSYSFERWVWSGSVLFHLLCIHSFYTFICFVVAVCFQGNFCVCVCV